MDRNCNKCIHHTSGSCSVWECTGTKTVEDVKTDAIDEVIDLYNEMRGSLATNVYEFGERLKQLKEQKNYK